MPPGDSSDELSTAVKRIDIMYDQIVDLNSLLKEMVKANGNRNTQHVVYESKGLGSIAAIFTAISAAVCILCVLFVVVEFNRQNTSHVEDKAKVDGQLRDIAAWQGVFGRDLTAIKTKIDEKEKAH